MTMKDRCLFIGRFQPFHHGHKEVVERLLRGHDEAIIAIGSAECCAAEDNPFSAGERVEMIRAAFSSEQLSRIIIVPVRDINNNSLWVAHLKSYVPAFDAVYTNNPLVRQLFGRAGVRVERIEYVDRGLKEGTLIRKMMASGKREWRKHVPSGTVRVIDSLGGEERMRVIMDRE